MTRRCPSIPGSETMTPERLAELRMVLAAMADTPIATLEAHPLPSDLDRSRGITLDAASPLATHLSQLISQTSKGVAGETLYRMVVPAKFAAQVGGGLLKPMTSKAGSGVRSALVGSTGIVGQASIRSRRGRWCAHHRRAAGADDRRRWCRLVCGTRTSAGDGENYQAARKAARPGPGARARRTQCVPVRCR